MSIQELLEELRIIANVRRHFTSRIDELEEIIDLDMVLQSEAQALQDKIPGGLVVWDESTQCYGVYPVDR
jgi:c-di-GMP-related signal transduction protein